MSYISTLADYEVAQCKNALTASNGKPTPHSVIPAEWFTIDPAGLGADHSSAIVDEWNGADKAEGTDLIMPGCGGHTGTANNAAIKMDFSGTTAPVGFSLVTVSAVANVTANANAYADGRWNSVHSYDGAVRATHNNMVYRLGGSRWADGNTQRTFWKMDATTGAMTQLTQTPMLTSRPPSMVYDAVSQKILAGFGGIQDYAFFNCNTETWSASKSFGGVVGWGFYTISSYDPTRGKVLQIGSSQFNEITVNWSAETISFTTFTPTGDTTLTSLNTQYSSWYSAAHDRYWLFGGSFNRTSSYPNGDFSNIYDMHPVTKFITKHPLSGATISPQAQDGTFSRYCNMQSQFAVGIVVDISAEPYVIKLPGTAVAPSTPELRIRRGARLMHQRPY